MKDRLLIQLQELLLIMFLINFIIGRNYLRFLIRLELAEKANVKKKSINFYSIKKSFVKISKVDVAIILIDSKEGLDKQDKRIINMVIDKAKSIVLVFNKIDLIKNKKNISVRNY